MKFKYSSRRFLAYDNLILMSFFFDFGWELLKLLSFFKIGASIGCYPHGSVFIIIDFIADFVGIDTALES